MRFNTQRRKKKCNTEEELDLELEIETANTCALDTVLEDYLIRTRRLLIVGEINEMIAANICSYLQLYNTSKNAIYMYINSPGGCLASGYAIIDQMLACHGPIVTIVRGQAYSMAAMIAAFGTKGYRYATPNSSLMLHSVIIQDSNESIERHSKMAEYIQLDYKRKVIDLAKRTLLTPKQLGSIMTDTTWMLPRQAIQIGLIDGIWTPALENTIRQVE